MLILFCLAMALGILSPLFRRKNVRAHVMALASAAGIILLIAVFAFISASPASLGAAANESNRLQAIAITICELPVLLLSLLSLRGSKALFWLGWAINALFSLYCGYFIVVLTFFWHW